MTKITKVIAKQEYAPGRFAYCMFDVDSKWLEGKEVVAQVTSQEKGWHSDPAFRYKFRIIHTTKGDCRLFPDFSMNFVDGSL